MMLGRSAVSSSIIPAANTESGLANGSQRAQPMHGMSDPTGAASKYRQRSNPSGLDDR
jgi:hypothetical protein